jgi:hypothetical protein
MPKDMSNRKNQEENQKLQINKGIEFMLRRRVEEVEPKRGLQISKTLNLLHKTFHFNLECFWEVDKPNEE